MDEMIFYNKHYITVDEQNRIIDGFSDAFRQPSETDICINEHGSYQFRLCDGGEENPTLFGWDYMIPLYKYEGGEIVRRTEEEIEADRPEPRPEPEPIAEPTTEEIINAMLGVE